MAQSTSSVNSRTTTADSHEAGQARGVLPPGTRASEFTLRTTPDQTVSLSEFRGRPVVLVFYPSDWSPVCGDQLALYSQLADQFAKYKAQLLGISVDGVWCHLAFQNDRRFRGIVLLSDFEPKGGTAKNYGVYRDKDGVSERALFVIDKNGIIRWSFISPIGINPGADGILEALDECGCEEEKSRPSKDQ